MAVPPNHVRFIESAGLPDVHAYGPDSQRQLQGDVFSRPDALTAATASDWMAVRNPLTAIRKAREAATEGWAEMSRTLTAMAGGADLILAGTAYQEIAANVAEFHGLPLAELHYFPVRANSYVLPVPLPPRVLRPVWSATEWFHWRFLKPAEDEQRRALGLPKASTRAVRRIVEGGALEIQAYDEVFFPGLTDEWRGRRPLVGSLTLEMPTDADDEVASWITAGPPPIYFGFGSMPVEAPADAVRMITEVCTELGERALICSGALELGDIGESHQVKVVPSANHAAAFPACRAIVHHGGAGTTAAGVRAGVPTVVLWVAAEQPLWGNQLKRLGIGTSRRFSATTRDSLLADLRTVLQPGYTTRARDIAAAVTKPAVSVAAAADLLEDAARKGRLD